MERVTHRCTHIQICIHSRNVCILRGQQKPRDTDGNTNAEREALVGKKKNPQWVKKRVRKKQSKNMVERKKTEDCKSPTPIVC